MLVPYWKGWYKLWSIRFMLLASALGGLAAIFPAFVEDLPRWLAIVLGMGIPMAAVVARLVAQPKVTHDAEDKS